MLQVRIDHIWPKYDSCLVFSERLLLLIHVLYMLSHADARLLQEEDSVFTHRDNNGSCVEGGEKTR